MNNEEKILKALEGLQSDMKDVKSDISDLKERMQNVEERTLKIELTQENIIIPNIQLLAEGHTIIQEQIRRLSVVEALQDDVATLKSAVKYLTLELENIKKAM